MPTWQSITVQTHSSQSTPKATAGRKSSQTTMWVMSSRLRQRRGSRRDRWASGVTVGPGTPGRWCSGHVGSLRLVGGVDLVEGDQQVGAAQRPAAYVLQLSYWVWSTTKWPRRNGEITNAGSRVSGPLECSAGVGIGVGGPGVDPFGQSLLGSESVEQREELPTLGGLEAATELLLVLNGDLHDFAEQPPALLCEVQGPHATIAGAGPSHEQAALLEGVDQGHHPAGRDLQLTVERNVVAVRAERRSLWREGDEVLVDEPPRAPSAGSCSLGTTWTPAGWRPASTRAS
jgi:hypothetical protein